MKKKNRKRSTEKMKDRDRKAYKQTDKQARRQTKKEINKQTKTSKHIQKELGQPSSVFTGRWHDGAAYCAGEQASKPFRSSADILNDRRKTLNISRKEDGEELKTTWTSICHLRSRSSFTW